jgi:hypothetical protein
MARWPKHRRVVLLHQAPLGFICKLFSLHMWLQSIQKGQLEKLQAAREYLAIVLNPEASNPEGPKPAIILNCEKPLTGKTDETPYSRLLFIYKQIRECLPVPPKQLQQDFNTFWKGVKDQRVIRHWQGDQQAWQQVRQEQMLQWLDIVIPELTQKLASEAPRASAEAVEAAGASAAPAIALDCEHPTAEIAAGPSSQHQAAPELVTALQPQLADSDTQPICDWLQEHLHLPKPPSAHAAMVAGLRCKSAEQLELVAGLRCKSAEQVHVMAFMYKAQAEYLKLREKKALLAMWAGPTNAPCSSDSKRTPAEKKLVELAVGVLAWKQDMDDYEKAAEDFLSTRDVQPPSRMLQANIVFQGRVQYCTLLTQLGQQCSVVKRYIADALKTRRSACKQKSLKDCGVHAELFTCPNTFDSSYEVIAEDLRCREDVQAVEQSGVYTRSQLAEILDHFTRFPVLTHQQVVRLVPPSKAELGHCVDAVREQLVRELPVLAIRLQYTHMQAMAHGHVQYIFVPALNGAAFAHFVHLLSAAEQRFNPKHMLKDAILVDDDPAAVESFEAWRQHHGIAPITSPNDTESKSSGPGKPRLTDDRRLGPDLKTFVLQYVHSRGQMSQEGTRRKLTSDVFCAPLQKIAEAVGVRFGCKVSQTGIRNLMPPLRSNAVNTTQRGDVNCRICRTVRGEKVPHERAAWASALSKMLRQLATWLSSRGVVCKEFSMDQLRKYPFWICATSGASPRGYMEVREDGLPGFSVLDHDTPVGPRMNLIVSGVEELQVSSDATPFDTDKPQLQVSSDGPTSLFLRPHCYLPTDAITNAKDFDTVLQKSCKPESPKPEFVLVMSDNGWDYSLHSMMQQHLMLRHALDDATMFVWATQAPSHSSWNPIERIWPIPRALLTGQHLGSSAYPRGVNPFAKQEGEPAEPIQNVLKKIATAGVKDAFNLLNAKKGNGFIVYAPDAPTDPAGNPKPDPTDYLERIRAHYNGRRDEEVEREAAVIFDHVTKLFNIVYWKMCTSNLCPHCTRVCERRRVDKPDWHPTKVLSLLRHNFYRPFLPEMPGDETGLREGDSPLPNLHPAAYDVVPKPMGAGRNPHRGFLDVMYESFRKQKCQNHIRVPVNPNRKHKEEILQCSITSKTSGERCQYFAKCHAELERHERYAHCVPQAPHTACAVSADVEITDAVDPLPGYALGDAIAKSKKRKKSAAFGEDKHDDDDADDQFMEDHGLLDLEHENLDGEASASSAGVPAPVPQPPAAGEPASSSAGALVPVPQPAAAVAAAAAPAAGLAAVRPPRSSGPGGWQVVSVPGGWLKFSQTLGRLDAHCSRHGGGCKMDRSLRKGPIALHMAWLTCAAANKAEHDAAKITVIYDIEATTRGKEVFVAMAQGQGGLYQTILDAENRLCGQDHH